jgi:hypothetical protein
MTDPKAVVIPIWMGMVEDAVAKFKGASVEEQEVICDQLGEKSKEAGAKARPLFGLARVELEYQKIKSWDELGKRRACDEFERLNGNELANRLRAKLGLMRRLAGQRVAVRKVEPEPKPKIDEPEPASEPVEAKLPSVVPSVAPAPAWDQAIAAMNRQHAIIENVGGKAVIASWEPSTIDPGRLVVVVSEQGKLPAEIFQSTCLNRSS